MVQDVEEEVLPEEEEEEGAFLVGVTSRGMRLETV